MTRLVDEYVKDPPTEEEANYVIDDFINYFQFALDTVEPQVKQLEKSAAAGKAETDTGGTAAKNSQKTKTVFFPKIEPSDDPIADLNRLDPYQISVINHVICFFFE